MGEVSAQAAQRAAAATAPPARFKPPRTEGPDPDRSPRAGFDGVITAGEFAAGSGSFVRYANSVGIETKWVAEKVPALEAQAAAEAKDAKLAAEAAHGDNDGNEHRQWK